MKKSVENILKTLDNKSIKEMYFTLKDTLNFDLSTIKKMIKLKSGIDILTFNDLVFKPHPVAMDGIYASGDVNGKKYSIISGPLFYSSGVGVDYEVFNTGMSDPEGYLSEESVTLTLLDLYENN